MSWRTAGPVVFATLLFVIELSIKGMAYNKQDIWIELPPSIALWAVGVLFSLAVSEQTLLRGGVGYRATAQPGKPVIELEYELRLPSQIDFTPKYLYLFVVIMTVWIVALLLSQEALANPGRVQFLMPCAWFLSGGSVAVALLTLTRADR